MIDERLSERLVSHLTRLFCAPGSVYEHDDQELHRARLAGEWRLGQWTLSIDEQDSFLGWASWYRIDDETLAGIRRGDADDWVRRSDYRCVWAGPHCFIATIVVAPDAPLDTYRRLIDDVGRINSDAESLSGFLVRPERCRFVIRRNDGTPDWWRRRQDQSWR